MVSALGKLQNLLLKWFLQRNWRKKFQLIDLKVTVTALKLKAGSVYSSNK
jgi:hypothetical protein